MKFIKLFFLLLISPVFLTIGCNPSKKEQSDFSQKNNYPKIEWVNIPGGSFMIGSSEDELQRQTNEKLHKVTLKAFKMSKYEITFEQYDAFCEATGRKKPKDEGWGRGKMPVINVTWNDANDFAKWVGARLPTEAEWEYACRAGTTTRYNIGDTITQQQANFMIEDPNKDGYIGGESTKEVGSYEPNAWGIYDMHGNVFEWTSDQYVGPENTNAVSFVIRGGGFFSVLNTLRSARRIAKTPDFARPPLGIRLVRDSDR